MGGNASGISGGDRVGEKLNGTEFLKRLEETQRLREGQTPAEQKESLEKLKKEFSLSDAKLKLVKDGFALGEDPALVMKWVIGEKVDVTKTDRLKDPKTTKRTGVNLRGKVASTANPRLEAIKTKREELVKKMTFGFEVSLGSVEFDRADRGGTGNSSSIRSEDQARLQAAFKRQVGEVGIQGWDVGTDCSTLEIRPPVQTMETIFSSMEPLFKAAKDAKVTADFGFGGYYGLRNLLVEVFNRPYIQAVFEELEDDQAKSIRQRGQTDEFKTEIDAIDQKWRDTKGKLDMESVLEAFRPIFSSWSDRFRDVNLSNLFNGSPPTVEFRMHRGESSAADCSDLSEFWTYALASMSLEKSPVPMAKMGEAEAETLRMPSRAKALFQKFTRDIGIPNVEIRFADFVDQNDTPAYEVLVRDPDITRVQFGENAPIQLFAAPELGEGVRIGKYVHREPGNVTSASWGVPGRTPIDFTEARRPVDEFKPVVK